MPPITLYIAEQQIAPLVCPTTDLVWIRLLGSTDSDSWRKIARDNSGNLYLIGSWDTDDFAPAPGNEFDFLFAKYDNSGTLLWVKAIKSNFDPSSSNYDEFGFGVTFDNSGNMYFTGETGRAQRESIYTAKISSDGSSILWETEVNSGASPVPFSSYGRGNGIELDTLGNAYVVGYLDYPSGLPASGTIAIILKFNPSGNLIWQRGFAEEGSPIDGGSFGKALNGIAIDSSNNIYACGVDNESTTANAGLLLKYNSSNILQWKVYLGGPSTASPSINHSITFRDVAIDSTGNNIYVVGFVNIISGPESGDQFLVVAKYDTDGNLQWQRRLGKGGSPTPAGDPNEEGYGICVDSLGNVYFVGHTRDDGVIPTEENMILGKYDSNGTLQWQRVFGSAATEVSFGGTARAGITTDDCFLYIATDTNVNTFFASPLRGIGREDGLLVKVPTDGTQTGLYDPFTYQVATFDEREFDAGTGDADGLVEVDPPTGETNVSGIIYDPTGSPGGIKEDVII